MFEKSWNALRRAWEFSRRREWVLVLGLLTAVVVELQNQLANDVTTPDWKSILLVIVSFVQRNGVFSQNSVDNLKQ